MQNKILVLPKDQEQAEAVEKYLSDLNIAYESVVNKTNGLDWFEATESLRSILNSLISYYSVEELNLLNKPQTSEYKTYCIKMQEELLDVNRDTEIWQSLDLMNQGIAKYGPWIKKINAAI